MLTPDGTRRPGRPGPGKWIGPIVRIARSGDHDPPRAPEACAPFLAHVSRENLLVLKELIEAGKVRPVIDRTYPFDQIPDAVRYLEGGGVQGKVVITMDETERS